MSYYSPTAARDTELPNQLQDALEGELGNGERLLWVARPGESPVKAGSAWTAFVFAIPWTACAIYWTVMTFVGMWILPDPHTPSLAFKISFPLVGLLFVAIGVELLRSPFEMKKRWDTVVYAITDRRVILMSVGKKVLVRSYTPTNPNYYRTVVWREGVADLSFGLTYRSNSTISQGNMAAQIASQTFYGIPDAQQVEALLRETFVDESQVAATGVGKAPVSSR